MIDLLPLVVLGILLAVNMPVAFALAGAAVFFFIFGASMPMQIFVQRFVAATEAFPLLAVPFFILAGIIMNEAGITGRMMRLADVMIGHKIGGLARVNVLLSTLMGGMSGSSNADAAMQSTLLVPEMTKRGYDKAFSAAITAFSSIISAIIPPGIGLILYGFLANVSIGRLFLAGIVPGVLICILLLLAVGAISRREGYPPSREVPANLGERGQAFADALWALAIPVGILSGIRLGFYTPTEAGAATVVYSLFIGLFIYRELKIAKLPRLFGEAAVATGVIMIIICAAQAFGFYLAWDMLPAQLAKFVMAATENPIALLLIINLMLIVVGMLLEGGAALIILTPLLVPMANALGVDLVHLGIVIVLNLTIAGVTPPIGTLMYTTCSITGVSIANFTKRAVPLFGVMAAALFLVTMVPVISLWLPNLVYGAAR